MESQVPAGVIYTKSQTPWSHSRWRVKLQDAIDTTVESQAPWCYLHWRVKLLGVVYTGDSSSLVIYTG